MFVRFSYEHLRNEAHVQLHENFVTLVSKHNPETLGIAALYAQYLPLLDREKSALDAIVKSGLSAEVVDVDRKRDSLFRGLADAVKSARNHYDEAAQRAAEKLSAVLAHYGNLAARPLDEETAAIDDLLRELATPENAQHVQQLGLDGWLTRLAEANRAFSELMMARYAETAARPTVHMRSTRAAVDKLFRAMLDLLEALAMVNGAEKYAPFVAEFNAVLTRYENILAQERGMRKTVGSGS